MIGVVVLALMLAWTGSGAWAQQANRQTSKMTDQQISDAIEDELLFDRAVPATKIDIAARNGVVTLSGRVSNLMAKRRAARIAETVKGVRSVVNNIDVSPAEDVSDGAIRNDIISALAYDPAADSYEIDVTVDDGVATLTGTVESWQEKRLAQKVAAGVSGVTGVDNEILVDYETERPDREIEPEIERALRWDTLVDDALIDVSVNNGNVTLSGIVGSAAEKRLARYDAWVAGVRSVDASELEVERWARDEDLRREKYTYKPADSIEQAIRDAMVYEPRVNAAAIEIDVSGSVATLRGTVENLKAKRAASSVARNTVGVTSVTNRVKVRPDEKRDDEEIAGNVRQALLRNPYVDRFDITVTVVDDTAYLYGTVDTFFEKGEADDTAASAQGVDAVRNHLTVMDEADALTYDPYTYDTYVYDYDWYDYQPAYTYLSDAEIKEEVNDEMWWSPFVDSDEVQVSVDDGVATLTGIVDSWSEREAARENAYEGGATWVINDLDVE
jgi:osmotically-inducible protein OsmY